MQFDVKIDQDLLGLRSLEKHCKALNKRHIRFGWIDGKNYPSSHNNKGLPIAQVAHWQEFGLGGSENSPPIPPRPYFRQTLAKVNTTYNLNFKTIFTKALQGEGTLPELEKIAQGIETNYRESVARQNFRQLSAYTVKLKGHTYQMVDSGVMTNNFKAKVYRSKIPSDKGGSK